jgi:flap endonuclease-1
MGIRKLNKFLQNKCATSITKRTLFQLKNKKIAIDASNMLYRLNVDDELIPMLYQTIVTFKYYNIVPLFVFDGPPPEEKKEKLIERRKLRIEAAEEYATLINDIETNTIAMNSTLRGVIDRLEKTKTRLSMQLINDAKLLLSSCGIPYIDAVNEADELCAFLVNSKIVWGVISEDMDLFVHGCQRVIRYFSASYHNCVVYELSGILSELKMTMDDFRAMCVYCSNDYDKCSTLTVFDVWHEGLTKTDLKITNGNLFEKIVTMYELCDVGEKSEIDYKTFAVNYKECNVKLTQFILEQNGFVSF